MQFSSLDRSVKVDVPVRDRLRISLEDSFEEAL